MVQERGEGFCGVGQGIMVVPSGSMPGICSSVSITTVQARCSPGFLKHRAASVSNFAVLGAFAVVLQTICPD